MSQPSYDTVVVGQGLAGSALAWHLIHAGRRVVLIDDGHHSSSSRVAAGLINPLAGMRFNRRPELADWLASALAWYEAIRPVCGQAVFHPLPMLRLFRSAEQRRFHRRRRDDPATRDLLGEAFAPEACPEGIRAPHGGFVQHSTGYVDLPRLLDRLRGWLAREALLIEQRLAVADLQLRPDGVLVGGLRADRVVFCEGAQMRFNPWFADLPLAPDRGEILDLRSDDWHPRHIINGAHWLVPTADGRIRLGATHDHRHLELDTTPSARTELLAGLHAILPDHRLSVTAQQVGIRPGTSDRYPLLGRHPRHRQLWVCNGFGARGALTIPWYTHCLARHLVDGVALPAEADIGRFR
jgi:glycine/D-amino acid oxidase-like deaminating enzyme